MVQFFQLGPSPKDKIQSMLGQTLGQGLSNFSNSYYANKALDKVLSDPNMKKAPLSERQSALQRALQPFGETGSGILQNRMAIEQQHNQEREQETLGRMLSGEKISSEQLNLLSPQSQFQASNILKSKRLGENIEKSLVNAGIDPEEAKRERELFESSTEGGRTAQFQRINEMIRRKNIKGYAGQESSEKEILPEVPEPEGMTPAETVKYHERIRKENLPHFESSQTQRRFLKKEKNALSTLGNINSKPGAIPDGIGRIMIDPETGGFRPYAQIVGGAFGAIPPEAQLFVKTIYDFTTQAKDSFGSRVTNFDLQTFMNRLPSLMNDTRGRALILEQMNLINQLNSLHENAMDKVYKKHGLANIPYERAVEQAENMIQDDEEKISNQLHTLVDRADEIYSKLPKQEEKPSISKQQKNIPKASSGHVMMEYQGQIGEVPENEVEEAIKNGAKRL